jgi:hypothetical protein
MYARIPVSIGASRPSLDGGSAEKEKQEIDEMRR